MSDQSSARLMLPYLQPGQAQKELYHNEALALIDLALQPAVRGIGVNAPPSDPAPGDCWIVGDAPTGAWAGNAQRIAGWTEGSWRFVTPTQGMAAWSIPDAIEARFTEGNWTAGDVRAGRLVIGGMQVVGARQAAILAANAGATIDAEARAAINAVLIALRAHGLIAP